ncbi:phosphopentomutase-like [Paramacrobiotus metropolitanus]|uniref:phosphopentomutase-like n=1 Tax=Paramacrobiotus metropolitanus TaxID=2943436 RepID=UPI002445681F|nr:phosphopentomutase-like [Paramacrobiotus metropolitanus]XP_055336107.1 phosphopentomutase-like [Paramacrobiotus metropolitanus]
MNGNMDRKSMDLGGSPELDRKVEEWLAWDQNAATRKEITALVEAKRFDELEGRLGQRLAFGTAGLRGSMSAGFNHMNDLVIIQTTQGMVKYLLKTKPEIQKHGVVIGFDNRHNSDRFAKLAAAVFISQSVPVYLFSKICPTPFVPFAVLNLKCSCGIMITASHNPKQDNGYKVYWDNGAQITSPHDKGIAAAIEENLAPWPASWDIPSQHSLLTDPLDKIMAAYLESVKTLSLYSDNNAKSTMKFVYTPMHGVGHSYVEAATKAFRLPLFIPVEEQKNPDPEFPTVEYPNPEEGKSSLDLAVVTAEQHGSSVILANDPDADRFALAEKQPGNSWKIFSGNDIGTMLGWWMWNSYCKAHENSKKGDECYMIASTVSSKMLRAIAKMEGFNFEETLTGFKWIANRADELRKTGKTVLFGFEEAIGFMCGDFVLDKDGISACMVAAEMIVHLYSTGMTIAKFLESLHIKYGHHVTNNSYFLCYHPPTIEAIFKRLRNFNGTNGYPKVCGRFHVSGVRDLTAGYDSAQPDGRPILPVSKSSQMITFTFEEGIVATLRTSGTEPKLKYYTEICGQPGSGSREEYEKTLGELVQSMISEFLEPEKNNIHPKKD